MSRQNFRFIHATCLSLDEPLVGTGPLSRDDRKLVEDATFRAWDGIIEHCLAAQVEFLLLTGNSFHAGSESLRARVALQKGFEKLAAHDIGVFIAPGEWDPESAWRDGLHLPPNVTVLADEHHDSVAVVRDQRTLASLSVLASPHSEDRGMSGKPAVVQRRTQSPFHVGVIPAGTAVRWQHGVACPSSANASPAAAHLVRAAIDQGVDYVAMGTGHRHVEHLACGLLVDPGSSQSLTRRETGPRGFALVDVSSSGVSHSFVAVSPVRWEEFAVAVGSTMNWNDLAEKMALIVMDLSPVDSEELWLIQWKFTGSGAVFDGLRQPSGHSKLRELVEAELAGANQVRYVHQFHHRKPVSIEELPSEAVAGETSELLEDLAGVVGRSSESLVNSVRQELLELDWMKRPQARVLRETVQRLSGEQIAHHAEQIVANRLR